MQPTTSRSNPGRGPQGANPKGANRRRNPPMRFAGDAFRHANNPDDGPLARELISTIAWKQPPAAAVRAQVST